ncbi:hypothetical protein EV201_1269 [Ancylomarina subtilis]|uniref:Phage abortive infection protein n=1 Tax=Ancylomarina subtilis TaxID=1639035 RepID=A0A4Q7VKR3_9BACT|nr:hypothetical protein [Ancylomarina subtilis]RZT96628.1 hypothetical protein EV201_1269 [Ancylomarina subtilis]
MKEKKEQIKKRWMIFAFVILAILISFTPYLFSQFYTGIDFSKTGSIGDTIGGITAPFINLLAAFIIYISFNEQVKANKIQTDSLDKMKIERRDEQLINIIFEDSKRILDKIDSFEITSDDLNKLGPVEKFSRNLKGFEAIVVFFATIYTIRDNPILKSSFLREAPIITMINNDIRNLLDVISIISSPETKAMYFQRYENQIHQAFFSSFSDEKCNFHFDSEYFCSIAWDFSKINIKVYEKLKDSLPKT